VIVHNTGVINVENVKVALYIDNVPAAVGTIPFIEQNSENLVEIEWVTEQGGHEVGIYVSLEGVQESNYGNNTAATYLSVKAAGIFWTIFIAGVLTAIVVALLIWKYR
jgi:subtilase family serine protease